MHDLLFGNQGDWGEALDAKAKMEEYAKSLGLDMTKFVADRDSEVIKQTVEGALLEATKLQLDHTPTIYMNGEEIKNLSLNAKEIEKLIEDKLNGVVATSTNQ